MMSEAHQRADNQDQQPDKMSEVVTLVSISARATEKNLLSRAPLILVSWSQYDKMYPRQDLGGHGWLLWIFSELLLFSLNCQISGLGPRQTLWVNKYHWLWGWWHTNKDCLHWVLLIRPSLHWKVSIEFYFSRFLRDLTSPPAPGPLTVTFVQGRGGASDVRILLDIPNPRCSYLLIQSLSLLPYQLHLKKLFPHHDNTICNDNHTY